jgi:hypothetical protein
VAETDGGAAGGVAEADGDTVGAEGDVAGAGDPGSAEAGTARNVEPKASTAVAASASVPRNLFRAE